MGELRIKAEELLKVKKYTQELKAEEENLIKEKNIKEKYMQSMKKFKERIQNHIDNFQKNLLEASENGETLKIDIVQLDKANLVSWWDERRDNNIIHRDYTPIKSEIITFIDDVDLESLTDTIIVDKTLQELYEIIVSNDIYPQWRVKKSDSGKITSLYLEANPLISYQEKKDILIREEALRVRELAKLNQNGSSKKDKEKRIALKRVIGSILMFFTILYFSVAILTILSSLLGVTATSNSSFLEIAWPYFLISDFSNSGEFFMVSLPLGFLISIISSRLIK